MTRGPVNPRRLLAAVVVVLVIVALLPIEAAGWVSAAPSWLTWRLLAPVADPLTHLSAWARGGGGNRREPPPPLELQRNYDAMQQYNAYLLQLLAQREAELAALSQVPESSRRGVEFVPARVIAAPRDVREPVIVINKGLGSGVQKDQVVTAAFNLVGRVIGVDAGQARVRLINAPGTTLAVEIRSELAPPDQRGIDTRLRYDARRDAFVTDLRRQDPVNVGDIAQLKDQTWPLEAGGYIVGQVVAIEDQADDPILRKVAVIEPRLPLRHLTQVHVIVAKDSVP